MHGVCAANRLLSGFGQAEIAHLPLADEIGHGAHDLFDRDGAIDSVLIEEIDAIGLEAPERSLHRLTDVRWPAVHAGDLTVLEREAELRRDDDAIARSRPQLLQGAREQLLVPVRPV